MFILVITQMETMFLEYLPTYNWAMLRANVGKCSIYGASRLSDNRAVAAKPLLVDIILRYIDIYWGLKQSDRGIPLNQAVFCGMREGFCPHCLEAFSWGIPQLFTAIS